MQHFVGHTMGIMTADYLMFFSQKQDKTAVNLSKVVKLFYAFACQAYMTLQWSYTGFQEARRL